MKNIHILPTNKPSRLRYNLSNVLVFTKELYRDYGKEANQNIYITNSEEIKEGDWYFFNYQIIKCENPDLTKIPSVTKNYCKKIILTTDQDLIKDSVQAIDDEFLEWFVKNPSCEEVNWNAYPISPNGNIVATNRVYPFEGLISNFRIEYKIIIPKEEPKTLTKLEIAKNIAAIGIGKKEPKQETLSNYLQVCKECGSEEVARCKWVNVNTEEIYSADSGTTLEWCFNCKSETNIIDKED